MKPSFTPVIFTNPAHYNYLRKENLQNIENLAKFMSCASNPDEIITLARCILTNDRRNKKIERHEIVISEIKKFIREELEEGDCFTVQSLASYFKHTRLDLCEKWADRWRAPVNATCIAIQELIESNEVQIVRRKYGDNNTVKFCYYKN